MKISMALWQTKEWSNKELCPKSILKIKSLFIKARFKDKNSGSIDIIGSDNSYIIKYYIIYIIINWINVCYCLIFTISTVKPLFLLRQMQSKYWRRLLIASCSYRTRQLSRSRSLLDIHRFLDPRGRSTRRCKLCLPISMPEFCSTSR